MPYVRGLFICQKYVTVIMKWRTKAASALNHPNIVTVFEVVRWEQTVAIAMELVQDETLRASCGEAQPLLQVLSTGEQLAQALAANIVHRDIKPENIILRADGYLKILDFGLARRLDAETISHPGLPAGTYRYMSPEQAHGQKLTAASDIFSMGLVLFELAAGSHPFPAETALEAMLAIAHGELVSLATANPLAPRDLTALIERMLARDPAARPTANEVAAGLKRIKAQLPSSAGPPPLAPTRRNALRWAIAASPAAALGWYFWNRSGAEKPGPLAAVRVATGDRPVCEAALSPDGNTLAYGLPFVGEDLNLYSKTITGPPVKLTTGPEQKGSPAWSPDGMSIAFLQMAGTQSGEIRIMPAAGGPSRRVAEVLTPQIGVYWFPGPSLCWSPDPSWLVVSARPSPQESFSLFLVHVETGQSRQLTDSARVEAGDRSPSFSPDGRTLAFSRLAADGCHLYIMPVTPDLKPDGPARRIETGKQWNTSPTWTANGRELVFSTGSLANPRLARISPWAAGALPAPITGFGESGWFPIVARATAERRLFYLRRVLTSAIWRIDLAMRGGVPVAARPPVRVVAAVAQNSGPVWAPDGQRFAFVSSRSGHQEVWVAGRDGANPVQWTGLESIEVSDPRWLADGRVTFTVIKDGKKDQYVVGPPPSKPEPLMRETMRRAVASPDGKWIYFARPNSLEIWRVPASGAGQQPTRVTEESGYNLAPGARWTHAFLRADSRG